ncbi:Putative uncharacterized protein [Moritella viscosa]|nr:Putative uncharacterized protein [Moritella viscosa]
MFILTTPECECDLFALVFSGLIKPLDESNVNHIINQLWLFYKWREF